jgi:hypothetical protein
MSKQSIFIQVEGKPGVTEAELPHGAVLDDLFEVLKQLEIAIDGDTFLSLDEGEVLEPHERKQPLKDLKHGTRVHVSRCRRIRTTVHFLEKTAHHDFPPGARVRTIKAWAVKEFKIEPKDAGEHVLRICDSTVKPATDTPLNELVPKGQCSVCFDLVPDKRVEG